MTTKLREADAALIKDSIKLEKKIMDLSIREYSAELKAFEKKHNMKTKKFIERFNSGELGDNGEWFDWLFVHKAYSHLKDRMTAVESIAV